MERIANVTVERDVAAKMRDGTTLYADVYRPDGPGPFPVILMRLPYDKTQAQQITYAHPSWYARHGYLVVIQDVRGRWKSEGTFYPFRHEMADGYDTVEWVAGPERFEWESGNVRVLLPWGHPTIGRGDGPTPFDVYLPGLDQRATLRRLVVQRRRLRFGVQPILGVLPRYGHCPSRWSYRPRTKPVVR